VAGGTSAEVQGRWRHRLLLGAVALAVAWPALQDEPADGFPVSSYPMFAGDRDRIVVLATAVGRTADGDERRLGPHAVGGGDEVMLAASAARLAVAGGPEEVRRYCAEVAERVAGDDDVVRVEVRTEVRDAVADPDAERPAESVEVHASCEVR
jgi:hypothetical protein